jgi:hypothetical protein
MEAFSSPARSIHARIGIWRQGRLKISWSSFKTPVVTNSGSKTNGVLEHAGRHTACKRVRTLVVGLGHSESALSFLEHGGATFHNVGDLGRTGRLRFWCRDQLDEFMAEMVVLSWWQ